MIRHHAEVLFFSSIALIFAINCGLGYVLLSQLFSGVPSPYTNWLITIFAAEMLGAFVYGWHKVLNRKAPEALELEDKRADFVDGPDEHRNVVINRATDPMVVNKRDAVTDHTDLDARLKCAGDKSKDLSRLHTLKDEVRVMHGERALESYGKIDPKTRHYPPAVYSGATVQRELGSLLKDNGRYVDAIDGYETAGQLFSENEYGHFTESEIRTNVAAGEMMIGKIMLKLDRKEDAGQRFFDAWVTNPNSIVVHNLFDLAVSNDDLAEAEMWAKVIRRFEDYSSHAELVESKLEALRNKHKKNKH